MIVDPFETGPFGGRLVKSWQGWNVEAIPALYNARLIMYRSLDPSWYDHAWCYQDMVTASLAAIGWDPEVDDEPPGWHKRATPRPRRAPGRADGVLVRCEHGSWPDGTCQYIGCKHWTRPAEDDPC